MGKIAVVWGCPAVLVLHILSLRSFFSSADAQCVLQSLQQAMYDAGQVIEKSRS
jgi:hypothetical protein